MDPSLCLSPPADDALLLRCYLREGSEAAFRMLAERYLPLVWSVARRVVNGDAAMAEDIAQVVLADFARKAPSLPPGTVTAAWLHRHTVFTASKAVRSEVRRRVREQISAENETTAADSMNASSDAWADVAPHIDLALDRLSAADRNAVILRYYEGRPLREVSKATGLSEEAARKRIDRALTKLRSHLKRRGVVPAAALLASLLREQSIAVPSPGAAQRILSGAWSRVEAGAFSSAASALVPWWRRRSVLAGAAALFMAAGLWWMLDHHGSSAGENRSGLQRHSSRSGGAAVPGSSSESPSLTLTTTLITLPEKTVGVRILHYAPGRDDAALYRDLLAQAQALQRQIKTDEGFATTGHPLVILTGMARTKKTELVASIVPTPPADPFASPPPAPPFRPAASILIAKERKVPYAFEWDPLEKTGEVTESDHTLRNAGSRFEANVSPPDADDRCLIECSVDHMFAPPEQESWRYRIAPEGEDPDRYSIRQPVFHSFQCRFGPATVRTGEPVLIAMTALPPEVPAQSGTESSRLFVFLTLQP